MDLKNAFLNLGKAKRGKHLPEWYVGGDLGKNRINKGHLKKLKLLAKLAGKGKVVDVGFYSKPNPYLNRAIGLDVNVSINPKNYSSIIEWSLGTKIPLKNNSVDAIIIGETLMYVSDYKKMHDTLKEFNRILKKKGSLIISEFNPFFYYNLISHFFGGFLYSKEINFISFTKRKVENLIVKNYGFSLKKIYGDFFEIPFTNITFSVNWPKFTYHTIYHLQKNGLPKI